MRWTIVANTAAGRIAYGTYETREQAERRVAQIERARAGNPFPAPALSIEPEGEWTDSQTQGEIKVEEFDTDAR
jgi:hypothetical protein